MFDLVNNVYSDIVSDIAATFFDPRKRLFIGYLFFSFLIVLFYWAYFNKQHFFISIKKCFSKKVWLSKSAKADYRMIIVNKLLMLLIAPLLLSQLVAATAIFLFLYEYFPNRPQFLNAWSDLSVSLLFTAFYFLLDDFARFYVHRLLHRWPVLWAFHKVHHSAQRLTPLTVLRTHPVEMVVFSLRSVFVQAISISVFVFFLGDRADLLTVYGAMMFAFVFNMLGSNLRHSHVNIAYWKPVEKWLISPAQHHIHHSISEKHWDKNYGVALSVWDRLFGSFCYSEKNGVLVFGLKGVKDHSLRSIYCNPVVEAIGIVKKNALRFYQKSRLLFYRYSKVVMLWKY